ncbi:hypothetical protein HDV02_006001 [Globomyces sp. JEL0801]|nr:hypothetical protein HDV02_006001 [Globomyces sp. JEL0801]
MPVHNPQDSKLYDVHLSILKKVEGHGGVGQVYRAVYDGKQAVAKIPFDKTHETMIYEEGRMMSGFDSPYLVKYLAFMADANIQLPGKPMGKHTVLLLEYMNLGSFSKYLVNNSPNEHHATVKSRTLDLFTQSVKGLQYLHEMGFNHLDMKPDNILLHQESGFSIQAKLSDFGSTRKEGSEDSVFQTKGFVPPEALVSKKKTSKYDIYALGGIITTIITQTPLTAYWPADQTFAAKQKVLKLYIQNPIVYDMVIQCLSQNPMDRPSATQVLSTLQTLSQRDFDPFIPTNQSSKDLPNPTTFNVFAAEFRKKYCEESDFNIDELKKMVKPVAGQVSSNILTRYLLSDLEPLSFDEDESTWIDMYLDCIQEITEMCK